jgi:hypothetical protein
MEIKNIPGKGLYLVVKNGNKVRYIKWNDSASNVIVTNESIPFSSYDAEPARSSESNLHGGLLSLDTGSALGPATPANDITVTKGTGKILIVVNAGTDLVGTITVTGDTIDRNTGVKTVGDVDTIEVDALTTDGSTTDSNGNTVHGFTGAYLTSKWFTGTVVLSTSTLNLSDVDTYHVSFEQVNDKPDLLFNTFDVNLFTTNVAAQFDGYLYGLRKTTTYKCNIILGAQLHIGTDGETAIANKYWRLRSGKIDEPFDGNTDGFWVDLHYSNSPAYVEDVNTKVWITHVWITHYQTITL